MRNETEKTWAEQAQDILEAGLKQAKGGTTGGSQGACERYMDGEICKMLEPYVDSFHVSSALFRPRIGFRQGIPVSSAFCPSS